MLPYQKRVIQEQAEIKERAAGLSRFIGTSLIFKELSAEEQNLLREQCEIMWEYYEVLGKRIKGFKNSALTQKE